MLLVLWLLLLFFFFFFVSSSDLVILYIFFILFHHHSKVWVGIHNKISNQILYFFFIYNLMRDLCMRTKKQRFYILKYTHTIESFFFTCYTFYVFFSSFFIIIICGNWGNCFYNFNESEKKRAPPVREIKSLLRKQVREWERGSEKWSISSPTMI